VCCVLTGHYHATVTVRDCWYGILFRWLKACCWAVALAGRDGRHCYTMPVACFDIVVVIPSGVWCSYADGDDLLADGDIGGGGDDGDDCPLPLLFCCCLCTVIWFVVAAAPAVGGVVIPRTLTVGGCCL